LREAILEFSGIGPATRDTLASAPFDTPLRSHYARYMWGTLVGEGDELAAADQEYPLLDWRSGLKSFEAEEGTDRFSIGYDQTMTLRAAPGIRFQPSRFELWAAAGSGALPGRPDAPDRSETTVTDDDVQVLRSNDEPRQPTVTRDVRDLLIHVSEIAAAIGDAEPVERPTHEYEVATLFDRCRGMFNAALLLLAKEFVHEAAIFCGPLFVDSLALAEIADADASRRVELIVGRRLAALADVDDLFREMQAHGDDDVSDAIARLPDARRDVEEYARRHGAAARAWEPDGQVKRLADSHRRGTEYSAYLMTSLFSRGSATVTDERLSSADDNVIKVGGEAVNVDMWSTPTALFAAHSVAQACRATCRILGYLEPPELATAITKIEEMASNASTHNDSADDDQPG
jgi:hypothetical protein